MPHVFPVVHLTYFTQHEISMSSHIAAMAVFCSHLWLTTFAFYICPLHLLHLLLCWWKLSTPGGEYHPIVYTCTTPPSSPPLLMEVSTSGGEYHPIVYTCTTPPSSTPLLMEVSTPGGEYHPIVYMCTTPPSSSPLLMEVEHSSNTKSHVNPKTWDPNRAVCKFRRKLMRLPRTASPMGPLFVP